MNQPNTLKELLPEIRKYVIDVLEKNAGRSIYTTIGRLYRIEKNIRTITAEETLSDEEKDMVSLALYVMTIELSNSKLKVFDRRQIEKDILSTSDKICKKFSIADVIKERLSAVIKESVPTLPAEVTLPESKIIRDASIMEFTGHNGREYLKQRYEELVLRDFKLPQSNWYDTVIGLTSNIEAHTEYGKIHIQPAIEKLNKRLKKEKKELENRTSLLLKKEFNISELEIKKLKKAIKKTNDRDERGIQTLFRTTIRNHYTLNEMVDKKASIMITVNAIILSLVMGGLIGASEKLSFSSLPILGLSLTSILSIFFAIIAIRPTLTQGDFTEEEIRNKDGNLLYFGNFHNMHYRDFEWGFLQLLSDKNYLYGSMIRDYYYQGIGLNRKYKHINLSLNIFLYGFSVSFIGFLLVRILSNL